MLTTLNSKKKPKELPKSIWDFYGKKNGQVINYRNPGQKAYEKGKVKTKLSRVNLGKLNNNICLKRCINILHIRDYEHQWLKTCINDQIHKNIFDWKLSSRYCRSLILLWTAGLGFNPIFKFLYSSLVNEKEE